MPPQNLDLDSIQEILRLVSLFEGLSEDELCALAGATEQVNIAGGITLLHAGESVGFVSLILHGTASIVVRGEVVAERTSGELIGDMSAILEQPASASVVASTDLSALRISAENFRNLIPRASLFKLLKSTEERRRSLGLRLSEALQHTPQGLVKLDTAGRITADISHSCLSYLGAEHVYDLRFKDFGEVVEALSPGFLKDWDSLELLFSPHYDESQRQMVMSILPTQITLPGDLRPRVIALSYYSCLDPNGKMIGLDIGMSDITSEEMFAEVQERQKTRAKLLADPEGYMSLLALARRTEHNLWNQHKELLPNDLHTLKGVAGLFDLHNLVKLCHLFEDQLAMDSWDESLLHQFAAATAYVRSFFEHMSPDLRARFEGFVINPNDFAKLKAALIHFEPNLGLKIIERAESRPASTLAQRYAREVRRLNIELGKEVEFISQCSEVRIPRMLQEPFEVLIHLVRNAMDHGFASPEERVALGKPAQGTLTFSAEHQGKRLVLTLSDDGRGLDLVKIKSTALLLHMIDPDESFTDQEIAELIFHPGFSTQDEVNEISGRGIGMSAVKDAVEAVNGNLKVVNHPGQGCQFIIDVPAVF